MNPCACRDCFEITAGNPGSFCWECEEAECELDSECESPHAYGGGESDHDERMAERRAMGLTN